MIHILLTNPLLSIMLQDVDLDVLVHRGPSRKLQLPEIVNRFSPRSLYFLIPSHAISIFYYTGTSNMPIYSKSTILFLIIEYTNRPQDYDGRYQLVALNEWVTYLNSNHLGDLTLFKHRLLIVMACTRGCIHDSSVLMLPLLASRYCSHNYLN